MAEPDRKIALNMVQCRKCKTVLISTHRHDYRDCACGTFVDGGLDYLRRGATHAQDIKELSIYKENGVFRMYADDEE